MAVLYHKNLWTGTIEGTYFELEKNEGAFCKLCVYYTNNLTLKNIHKVRGFILYKKLQLDQFFSRI